MRIGKMLKIQVNRASIFQEKRKQKGFSVKKQVLTIDEKDTKM